MANYPPNSDKRVKELLLTQNGINDMLFDLNTHIRYLNYTDKEVESENVYRLPKLNWIAEGCPMEPIPKP